MQCSEQQQASEPRRAPNSDIYSSAGMCQWPLHKIRQPMVAPTRGKYLNSLRGSHLLDIETRFKLSTLDLVAQTDVLSFLSVCRQELGFHCCPQ